MVSIDGTRNRRISKGKGGKREEGGLMEGKRTREEEEEELPLWSSKG